MSSEKRFQRRFRHAQIDGRDDDETDNVERKQKSKNSEEKRHQQNRPEPIAGNRVYPQSVKDPFASNRMC